MQAESKFLKQSEEFWANVKLISQKIGYTNKGLGTIKVPSIEQIEATYHKLGLDSSKIVSKNKVTIFGSLLIEYFQFRAEFLKNHIEPNLQNLAQARDLYTKLKAELKPTCPEPLNKQKGEKQAPAYFTSIINMLIEANSKGYDCNYDPKELSAFTHDNFPIRSLSRRVDGSFPNVINPIALWEIKEYYYTTTFGSRVADGVYETQLDGYELKEVREHLGKKIHHCLMIDDHNTWWGMGKSYLCRICDMLHMGLVTEVIFGKEVVTRVPLLVKEWTKQFDAEIK
ncbi:DUF7687 domain-containing protein [Chryseobacterium glaciei]|uniref:DUF7687 domain-containing protein n=1 Tax=Chryseobacterium glaciei TaxID=1685010 RepID=UPI000A4072D3|nr:hypothetical protein [Chryseobacterium glaciei]